MAQNSKRNRKHDVAWFGVGVVVGALVAAPLTVSLARSIPDLEPSNWFDLAVGLLSALVGGSFTIAALWFGFRHERRQREAETRAGLAEQISDIMWRIEQPDVVSTAGLREATAEALALGRRLFATSRDFDRDGAPDPNDPDMVFISALFALHSATFSASDEPPEQWIRKDMAQALQFLMNEIAIHARAGAPPISAEPHESLPATVTQVKQLTQQWNRGEVSG
ncbi:hypothetical protein GWK18_04800 [Kocuria sp. JC486]|uniref:Uncharacterized protein n=1 Tax=Kocuria soli TaxID=2485125 RepID=A0A3N3ZTE3_9MICC|nr:MULTISPECIES: hypothetical protein [Kocuria]NHU84918.1 hypothetical protein [Kocuria sp. JC486]ROZ63356.1 hypothetical protein EDL96_07440 [Kocuria soli]